MNLWKQGKTLLTSHRVLLRSNSNKITTIFHIKGPRYKGHSRDSLQNLQAQVRPISNLKKIISSYKKWKLLHSLQNKSKILSKIRNKPIRLVIILQEWIISAIGTARSSRRVVRSRHLRRRPPKSLADSRISFCIAQLWKSKKRYVVV